MPNKRWQRGLQKDFICVGVDGCKGGWVAVTLTRHSFEIEVFEHVAKICAKYPQCDRIMIDMPMGLAEGIRDIRPDGAARKLLKGKASSIFNTPCRQAVYANSYSEANELNRKIMGKGISRQSYAISAKIRELDEFLQKHPEYKNRLLESHPELCFAMLNSGKPVLENKGTDEGMRKRIELLNSYYEHTGEVIDYVKGNPELKKHLVDVIDALCLAVSGVESLEKGLVSVPEKPMEDARGILMQIVYA